MNNTTLVLDAQELPVAARLLEEAHPRPTLESEAAIDVERALALVRVGITRARRLEGILSAVLAQART